MDNGGGESTHASRRLEPPGLHHVSHAGGYTDGLCDFSYDPMAVREDMDREAKHEEDNAVLHNLLFEFGMLHMCNISLPVQDEITNALLKVFQNDDISVPVCFATQILLDVHHGLRYSKERAYREVTVAGLRISKTVTE